jgi:cytochrome P450
MLFLDPPDHTRVRSIFTRAFTPRTLETVRTRIHEICNEQIELMGRSGDTTDLVQTLAYPLPVLVIAELLGVPASYADSLRAWSQAIVRMYEPSISEDVQGEALVASQEFADYMRALITERRADLGDDLLSDLLRAQEGDDGLTDDEVLASAILLLNAGHEASVNVFGNGLVALLEHPDQWQRLVDGEVDPAIAVEEMLRFDSALQLFERTATADVEVADIVVPEGEKVAVLLGAANRDPGVFDDADAFDVGRDPNPHLAFGVGVHFCLGAPLARVELAESLRLLTTTYPRLELAGTPRRRPTFVLRGYQSVPVRSTGG